MMSELASYSIYTTQYSDELREQAARPGSHTLHGHRPWRTGQGLWAAAAAAGKRMPVIFSGAEATAQMLLYWALIDDITVWENGETRCRYSDLHPIEPPKPLSVLWLRSDLPTSNADIYPYRICRTPAFISELADQPQGRATPSKTTPMR